MVIRAQSVWVGSFNGGNLNLRSGIGSSGVNGSIIFGHSLDTVVFDDNGAKFLNPSGVSNSLALAASIGTPTVPSGTNGLVYVDSAQHLNYRSSSTSIGVRAVSRYLTIAVVRDVSDCAASITSTSYVDVISGWAAGFNVEAGDFIEGEFFLNATYLPGTTNGLLQVSCNLNTGFLIENYAFSVGGVAGNVVKAMMPFSFVATASGTVSVTMQAKVSDGAMNILSLYYPTSNLWFRAKQIRP
jgi:hypothetical protein